MKKYQILLTGGKSITVDEKRKQDVERLWQERSERLIKIDGNLISASIIKGIFEIKEVDTTERDNKFWQENRIFLESLNLLSQNSAKEKTMHEIKTRVLPGLRIAKISESDPIVNKVFDKALEFFNRNPKYPRCPLFVYWDLIKERIKHQKLCAHYFDYVSRNDNEIAKWAKFNHIKLNWEMPKVEEKKEEKRPVILPDEEPKQGGFIDDIPF